MEKNKTLVTGTVYRREYIGKNTQFRGWNYIGETINFNDRNSKFHNPNNKKYGGRKIEKARVDLGVNQSDWRTSVLYQKDFPCTTATYEDVKKQAIEHIKPIQTKKIIEFDSIEHGFNTSLCDGLKGVTLDEETRKRIGAASRGRKHTAETRAKISAANTGRKVDEETRAKISAGNKGKKRTPEQNAAESARLKGKEPKAASEGARRWHAENPGWWANHPVTPEMRANMKKAQQSLYPDIMVYDKSGKMVGVYASMNEIKNDLGDAPGTIHNNLKHTDSIHFTKNGYRYEYKHSNN